jgi:hypothetical protein
MTSKTTWEPHTKHGDLTERSDLPDSVFAFPRQRKEPLTDASHVKNALARFDQVQDVSDADRDLAFANIQKAAEYYGMEIEEANWHELGGGLLLDSETQPPMDDFLPAKPPHDTKESRQAADVATQLSLQHHGWKQTGEPSPLWVFEHRRPQRRDRAEGRNRGVEGR